jgi:PhzF family phenazine biosynthesis protein
MSRPFRQVDVFTNEPYRGNPVAVVHDAAGLADEALLRFAQWTNLSETTFLLAPTTPEADYRVRIFTPISELPLRGTRPSEPVTPGSKPAASRGMRASSSRSAPPG